MHNEQWKKRLSQEVEKYFINYVEEYIEYLSFHVQAVQLKITNIGSQTANQILTRI